VGRIDIAAIVDAWAGRGSSLATKTARAWDLAIDDTACVEAVRVAVARAPEVAFGFTELSDAAMRGRWVWRMDGRLRADLQDIAGPIAQTSDGVAEAAFAFDVSRAYSAARRFAADIDRAAPGCIGTELASAWTLPEAIAAVKSGAATLHAYDPRDASLGYTIAIGLSDAERWINAVWPEIDLKDWPKRRAVAADKLWPSSRAWIDDAFVARTKDTVAVAGGDRARAHARRAARASGRDDDTLASLHLGLGLLRKAIPPRELRQALDELDPIERAFAEGLFDLLGDYDARLYADDAGLAAEWSLRLR